MTELNLDFKFVIADKKDGAEDGIRTRDLRHGKATLYQLSYFRKKDALQSSIPKAFVNEA